MSSSSRLRLVTVFVPVALALTLGGCGGDSPATGGPAVVPAALAQRVATLGAAVRAWQEATSLPAAKAAAEQAANLVTGPQVDGYGDRDGDGKVAGAVEIGLLPGPDGQPGLASGLDSSCLDADVLGGDWSDPQARWDQLDTAIADWSEANNTFPGLPSHPQRVVGWATLTLRGGDLDQAREYAGHARLHADVATSALADC